MLIDSLTLCALIRSDVETRAEARARKAAWDREEALRIAAEHWARMGGTRPVDPSQRKAG